MYLTLAEIQAFINFVNGNLGKKIFTDTNPSTVVSGKKLLTNGVGLGVDMVDDISYQLGIVGDWDITTQPVVPVDLKIGQRYFVTTEGTYNGVFADVGDIVEFTSLTSIFVYPVASTLIRLSDLTNYATKTYAESLVLGLLDDRGSYDPTITSAYPTIENFGSGVAGSILKGDLWFINTDGVIGTIPVLNGYSVRALVDNPGQSDANWNILYVGLGYIPEHIDNKRTSTTGALTSPDDITYPSTKVVDDALNLKADILNETHTGAMRLPSSLKIYDVISTTKEVGVDVSGLTAGTPRTVTFPDRDIALGDLPLFAATTKYRQYAIIQKDGLLYSAKTQFTSGSTFDVADWDSIGGVLKAQITGDTSLLPGYEYFNVASPNVAITLELPDPTLVSDGSRIVIHNLGFNAASTLGKTAWTLGTGFSVAPSYASVSTASIPAYSKGSITTLTSRVSDGVWIKEVSYGSTLPVGTSTVSGKAYFVREDDVTATVNLNLGEIPTATNRLVSVPNRSVTIGRIEEYNTLDFGAAFSYAIGDEVMSNGQVFVCSVAHTPVLANPDLTKFTPINGIYEVFTTSTGFAVPLNSKIILNKVMTKQETLVITGMNTATRDGRVYVHNVSANTNCTVTVPGLSFREQNDSATSSETALVLGPYESAYVTCVENSSNAYWRKVSTSHFIAENFRIRKTASNTAYATFNAAAVTGARTITLADANISFNRIEYVYSISSGTLDTVPELLNAAGAKSLKVVASGNFTINPDNFLGSSMQVEIVNANNAASGDVTITLSSGLSVAYKDEFGSTITSIVLRANERCQITFNTSPSTYLVRRSDRVCSGTYAIMDSLDRTKRAVWNVSAITTNTFKTITMPNNDVDLGKIGKVFPYANATPYIVGNEVTYLGILYICGTAHTSSTPAPDLTKFYPASGASLEAYTASQYSENYVTPIGFRRVFKQYTSTFVHTGPKSMTATIVLGNTISFYNLGISQLYNIKIMAYRNDGTSSRDGSCIMEKRVIVARGTESSINTIVGIPRVENISEYLYGGYVGSTFSAGIITNGANYELQLTLTCPNIGFTTTGVMLVESFKCE